MKMRRVRVRQVMKMRRVEGLVHGDCIATAGQRVAPYFRLMTPFDFMEV